MSSQDEILVLAGYSLVERFPAEGHRRLDLALEIGQPAAQGVEERLLA